MALSSIVGALIVIVGLYLLLWGKEGDVKVYTKSEEPKDNISQKFHLATTDHAINGEP